MLEGGVLEAGAGEAGEDVGFGGGFTAGAALRSTARMTLGARACGDEVDGVADVEGDVFEVGVEGDGLGGGDGPGGGGPDDGVDVLAGERGVDGGGIAGEVVADVDGGAGVLLVLDLGLGEGGAVVDAPVDGLEAFVDEAVFEEVVEGLDDAAS